MTSSYANDRKEDAAEVLMALLAHVSDQMSVIADELRKKPNVKKASMGCDARKYRDAFRFDDRAVYYFETYVEAEMGDGSLSCWFVDIKCTPLGWEIDRAVTRSPGDDEIKTFPVVSSPTFAEFAGKVSDAIEDLVEAARSSDFRDN